MGADCELHPLIHTVLNFNLAQDIESIKSEAEASLMIFEKGSSTTQILWSTLKSKSVDQSM